MGAFYMSNTSLRMYEEILDSLMGGLVYIDLSMRIKAFNQGAERICGSSRKKAIDSPLEEIFRFDPWFAELMEQTLSGKVFIESRGSLHRTFGEPCSVSITTGLVYDDEGAVKGGLAFIRDIASGGKALESLSSKGGMLTGMSFFASRLVHEIRNPLGGVRAAAQLLSKKASLPGLSDYTDIIIRETDRLDGMLMEVAALTRPRSDIRKEINIHRLLDSVVFLITGERPDLTVMREYDPSLPLVSGDDNVLTQVFLNLVKNAREALPEGTEGGGTITVATRIMTDFHISGVRGRGARMAAVEIRDNGCGIASGDLDNVFTPFFTTKQGGSGLGMPVSLKIVKEQGGYMNIDSTPGKGTRVRVFLPIVTAKRGPVEGV